ncbi:hypothetical protein D3C87_39310 [compost metagenome]
MRIQLIAICLFFSLKGFSQERKPLDAKSFNTELALIGKKMNAEMISCKFKREVFKDIKSSSVMESSSGEIIRGKGWEYKMMTPSMLVLQTKDLNVVIDSLDKVVYISNIDSTLRKVAQLQEIPLEVLKEYTLEKIVFPSYYILRAEPANVTIGIMEFYIHSQSQELYKLNVYYPPGNYFSDAMEDESVESPYVSIIYEPMKKLKGTASPVSLENILQKTGADEYTLSPEMQGFQLKDSRYKPTK